MAKTDAVLVVEDDDDIRDSIVELLALRGFDAVAATNGREALDQLAAGLLPCLIILDLMLPVVSGWEFRAQQLADPRFSQIPILILSGAENLAAESRQLQAVAFESKPVQVNRLFKTIEQYC